MGPGPATGQRVSERARHCGLVRAQLCAPGALISICAADTGWGAGTAWTV